MSTETLGTVCAKRIIEAKRTSEASGTKLMQSDIARLIDQTDAELRPNGSTAPSKAISGQFGNRRHIPPTPELVAAYSSSIGYPLDGQKWCDFYAAKGWMVGKSKMKDWQAAVRNWKTNSWGTGSIALAAVSAPQARDYSRF